MFSLIFNPLQYGVKPRTPGMLHKLSATNYILVLAPPPAVFEEVLSM